MELLATPHVDFPMHTSSYMLSLRSSRPRGRDFVTFALWALVSMTTGMLYGTLYYQQVSRCLRRCPAY
jgi:hypothetical protein